MHYSNIGSAPVAFHRLVMDVFGCRTLIALRMKHPCNKLLQVSRIWISQRGLSLPLENRTQIIEKVATVAVEGDQGTEAPDVTFE